MLKDRQQIVQGHSSFFTVSCGNRTSWFFWMHLRQKGIVFFRQSRCSPRTPWGEICRMRLFAYALCVSYRKILLQAPLLLPPVWVCSEEEACSLCCSSHSQGPFLFTWRNPGGNQDRAGKMFWECSHISDSAADVKIICVICRRIRPPKYLLRPWMPLEGRWQQLPPRLTSNPQVLDFPV